jgi:hypothetical protein
MAHYAFLDENNSVVLVIVGKDENEDNVDWEVRYSEIKGMQCKRTSYHTAANIHTKGGVPFRKNFAGIGYTYDSDRDAFIPPKPFASWSLNEDTCLWEAPIPMPTDGDRYLWDEEQQNWVEITI